MSKPPTMEVAIPPTTPRRQRQALLVVLALAICSALVVVIRQGTGTVGEGHASESRSAPEARAGAEGQSENDRAVDVDDPGSRTGMQAHGSGAAAPSAESDPEKAPVDKWHELRQQLRMLADLHYPRDAALTSDQLEAVQAAMTEYRPLIVDANERRIRRVAEIHGRLLSEGHVEIYASSASVPPAGPHEILTEAFLDHPAAGTPGEPDHVVTRIRVAEDDVLYQSDRELRAAREGLSAVLVGILGQPRAGHSRR